jgi:hypothetical protein
MSEHLVVTESGVWIGISKQKSSDLFAGKWLRAPATINDEGLADATAALSHEPDCFSLAPKSRDLRGEPPSECLQPTTRFTTCPGT